MSGKINAYNWWEWEWGEIVKNAEIKNFFHIKNDEETSLFHIYIQLENFFFL